MLRSERGFALEATVLILLLVSVLMVIGLAGVTTTTRTANFDYRNSRVFYASEAAAEGVIAQLEARLVDGALADSDYAALTAPSVPGFTVDSFGVSKVGGIVQETIANGPYTGLYSATQNIDIYSSVKDALGNRSANIVSVKAQSIPLFQFGVFYEGDLEVDPQPPMTFGGWTHSNGKIYVTSNNLYFLSMVTTPNIIVHNDKWENSVQNGVQIANASGTLKTLNFDSRSVPNFATFRSNSHTTFDDRLKTNAYGVDTLKVPLPSGVTPLAVIQPRVAGDVALLQSAKYSWKADWYIVVPVNTVAAGTCPTMVSTRGAGLVVPTGTDCQNIFRWTWEAFFDGRERRYVDVLDIDIAQLGIWVNKNIVTNATQIMYVTFSGTPVSNATNNAHSDGFRPVVRLINGSKLPNALTIATDRMLYVKGKYNTNTWVPASLVGDAITILAPGWTDASHTCTAYDTTRTVLRKVGTTNGVCNGFTVAVATVDSVFAAILAGHSGTPCDVYDAGCSNPPFGGGLENFPRFLDDWTGVSFVYTGSLVSLSETQYFKRIWLLPSSAGGTDWYYNPPDRNWTFDTRFSNPVNLPPGTPTVGNMIHAAFRPVY
jgi:hypothetical protein